MVMSHAIQYSPPRKVPSEVDSYYDTLCTFKDSFTGGSEREYVARAIQTKVASSGGDRLKLLDIGASDCRNTSKILKATSVGLDGFKLVTIDPDHEALTRTPDEITRSDHFSIRFQDIEPSEAPTVDVILFSHSLYYFESPIDILKKAKYFVRPGGRIIVSMWDRGCNLRAIASRLAPDTPPPISGSELFDLAVPVGSRQWHGTWSGGVDFDAWRDSQAIASAAADILSPRKRILDIPGEERIRQALHAFGRSGTRKNAIFSIDIVE